MDKALFDHTMEQLRSKATSDMVCHNALWIIEALQRGEDPLQAAPRKDHFGEAVAHKYGAQSELDLPAPPKKGRKK
jgi:hypothetical protein